MRRKKDTFKLFDFFGNCEYFEEKYDYDEVIKLPVISAKGSGQGGGVTITTFENFNPDPLKTMTETKIGLQGMKIDRMFSRSSRMRLNRTQPHGSNTNRAIMLLHSGISKRSTLINRRSITLGTSSAVQPA